MNHHNAEQWGNGVRGDRRRDGSGAKGLRREPTFSGLAQRLVPGLIRVVLLLAQFTQITRVVTENAPLGVARCGVTCLLTMRTNGRSRVPFTF